MLGRPLPMLNLQLRSLARWRQLTGMHGLDVPGQHAVNGGVDDEHDHGQQQVEVVALYWGLVDGAPLDAHSGHLVQGEVLGAQAKRRGGHQGL